MKQNRKGKNKTKDVKNGRIVQNILAIGGRKSMNVSDWVTPFESYSGELPVSQPYFTKFEVQNNMSNTLHHGIPI